MCSGASATFERVGGAAAVSSAQASARARSLALTFLIRVLHALLIDLLCILLFSACLWRLRMLMLFLASTTNPGALLGAARLAATGPRAVPLSASTLERPLPTLSALILEPL